MSILAQADGTGKGEWAMHPLANAEGLSGAFSVTITCQMSMPGVIPYTRVL